MSRLDLLKKNSANDKKNSSEKKKPREGMLDEKSQSTKQREDNLTDDILSADDFENELEDTTTKDFDIDRDQDEEDTEENVNVIEIDIDTNKELEIDPSLIDDEITDSDDHSDNNETLKPVNKNSETHRHNDIVEGNISVDYSEEDIKFEIDYTYDHREDVHNSHVKVIKDGGMEINTPKILQLHDIVRISVTLTELKEQVGCEARVVSVFPQTMRASSSENDNRYRYIVQFIGPNASETERVLSKYLLGYKAK